jgi:hypothetical protein
MMGNLILIKTTRKYLAGPRATPKTEVKRYLVDSDYLTEIGDEFATELSPDEFKYSQIATEVTSMRQVNKICKKCGSEWVHVKYVKYDKHIKTIDELLFKCGCGYEWTEPPLDAKDNKAE